MRLSKDLSHKFSEKSIEHDINADAAEDHSHEREHRQKAFRLARAADYLEERSKKYGAGYDMTRLGAGKKYGE